MFSSALVEHVLAKILLDQHSLEGTEHDSPQVTLEVRVRPYAEVDGNLATRTTLQHRIAVWLCMLLQALRLAKDLREHARDQDSKRVTGVPAHSRGLTSASKEASTSVSRANGLPLVAIYLHRSTAYVTAVLAALASG